MTGHARFNTSGLARVTAALGIVTAFALSLHLGFITGRLEGSDTRLVESASDPDYSWVDQVFIASDLVASVTVDSVGDLRYNTDDGARPVHPNPRSYTGDIEWESESWLYRPVVVTASSVYTGTIVDNIIVPDIVFDPENSSAPSSFGDTGTEGMLFVELIPHGYPTTMPDGVAIDFLKLIGTGLSGDSAVAIVLDWFLYDGSDAVGLSGDSMSVIELETRVGELSSQ